MNLANLPSFARKSRKKLDSLIIKKTGQVNASKLNDFLRTGQMRESPIVCLALYNLLLVHLRDVDLTEIWFNEE